ncbi:MAG TPA: TetR/AcrR family transcriptional regulator [Halioglobus sp.]
MGRPQRKTQAERLAETRRRIIDATIACIDELGFHNTTIQNVSARAGVTVGGVQHHFNSKSQLLEGVLLDSFQHMAFDLDKVPIAGKTLQDRVELFVDECWEHCNSPAFQASMQILRGLRNESPEELDKWLQVSLSSTVTQGRKFWSKMFSEIELPKAEHQKLLNFVFSSLNGVVSFSRINLQPSRVDNDLRQLKNLLLLRFQEALKP